VANFGRKQQETQVNRFTNDPWLTRSEGERPTLAAGGRASGGRASGRRSRRAARVRADWAKSGKVGFEGGGYTKGCGRGCEVEEFDPSASVAREVYACFDAKKKPPGEAAAVTGCRPEGRRVSLAGKRRLL